MALHCKSFSANIYGLQKALYGNYTPGKDYCNVPLIMNKNDFSGLTKL